MTSGWEGTQQAPARCFGSGDWPACCAAAAAALLPCALLARAPSPAAPLPVRLPVSVGVEASLAPAQQQAAFLNKECKPSASCPRKLVCITCVASPPEAPRRGRRWLLGAFRRGQARQQRGHVRAERALHASCMCCCSLFACWQVCPSSSRVSAHAIAAREGGRAGAPRMLRAWPRWQLPRHVDAMLPLCAAPACSAGSVALPCACSRLAGG